MRVESPCVKPLGGDAGTAWGQKPQDESRRPSPVMVSATGRWEDEALRPLLADSGRLIGVWTG